MGKTSMECLTLWLETNKLSHDTMTLIKSISGFRGTIGGRTGDTLNPVDIAKSVSAYASLREKVVNRTFRRKVKSPLPLSAPVVVSSSPPAITPVSGTL